MQFDSFKIGEVSSIDPARCTARVIFDDENSMVSYDLPIMQRNSFGNRDYQMVDVGEDVLCLFRGDGFEDGVIIGSFYAGDVEPPETTADRRTVVFKDGTRICYDRASHTLTVTIAGTVIVFDRQTGSITVPESASVFCKTALVQASESVTIDSPNTLFTGNIKVQGLITGQGGFTVTGLIYGIEKGLSQAETLAFASAVSAFAVSQSNVGVSDIALLEPILANVKISVIEG